MSDRPQRPWAWKVEPKCPVTPDSKERQEKKRQAAIEENRKRPRGVLDEVPGADGSAGVSVSAPASAPEDVLRPEHMKTCRLAGISPASFTPAQHLYMCCGRPFVVHLLMSLSPPPPFLIATWFDASKIWVIRLICFELFSGASCFFLVFGPMHPPEPSA